MTIDLIRAVKVDIPIMQGNTMIMQLRFYADKKKTTKTVITGTSFVLIMKRSDRGNCCFKPTDTGDVQTLSIGSGLTIGTAPDDNLLTVNADLTLDAGKFTIDLTGTDASGVVTTWLTGNVKVEPRP